MTGKELKLKRVGADVRAKDLAAAMGIANTGVSRIEGLRQVTPEATERYLAALATLTTSSTLTPGAEGAA